MVPLVLNSSFDYLNLFDNNTEGEGKGDDDEEDGDEHEERLHAPAEAAAVLGDPDRGRPLRQSRPIFH